MYLYGSRKHLFDVIDLRMIRKVLPRFETFDSTDSLFDAGQLDPNYRKKEELILL